MAYSLVQSTNNPSSPTSFVSNVTAGNLLVVGSTAFASGLTVTAMHDAGGSTWTGNLFSDAGFGVTVAIYWAIASAGAGGTKDAITFTWSVSGDMGDLIIAEFTGNPVGLTQDGTHTGQANTSGNITLPSFTTSFSDDLLLCCGYTNQAVATAVSPWNAIIGTNGFNSLLGWNPDVAAGSHSPDFTHSGSYDNMMIALGKSSAAAAPNPRMVNWPQAMWRSAYRMAKRDLPDPRELWTPNLWLPEGV